MANTKNYSLRERIIDDYLRRGWYSRQQIEDACNRELEAHGESPITSRQTIQNDFLAISRKYGVTIDTLQRGRTTFYRYRDHNFTIYKSELTSDDYARLKEALKVLKRFEGLPQFEWVDELDLRLNMGLRRQKDNRKIVSFEDSAHNMGMTYFSTLFDAISDKITLRVDYKSFKRSEPKEFVISPYFLKEYNNRWFLLGKSPGYRRISIFALDRIEHLSNAGLPYEDTDIDFDAYFEKVMGVTVSDKPVELVQIWVSPQQLNYIKTKPLHRSQRITYEDEGGGIVEYDLVPNFEFEQAVFSQGEHVKILAPDKLREKFRERVRKLWERNYSDF